MLIVYMKHGCFLVKKLKDFIQDELILFFLEHHTGQQTAQAGFLVLLFLMENINLPELIFQSNLKMADCRRLF